MTHGNSSCKNDISVAVVPLDISFGDTNANLRAATESVKRLDGTHDIIVLPELFSTGYANNPGAMHELAETDNGITMDAVREMAVCSKAAVTGSMAASGSNGMCYNRAFFVEPDGHATFYDKRHLFSLSREGEIFGKGTETPPVIRFRGWNVALSVCYDLRFPAWMRNRAYAYDIMLLPANWPMARVYALEHLLIARAIENQAPIVCSNRGGRDDYGIYDGCSFAFDHMGMPAFQDSGTTATFSLESIRAARKRFPAANDADNFDFGL